MAIDERRRAFPPTLWDNLDALNAGGGGAYAQRWFPGDHGSVGGGGASALLSNDALLWVAEGAVAAGLALEVGGAGGVAAGARLPRAAGLARGRAALGRLLALDARERDGPARAADLAEAAVRRWRRDPGYRPGALRRVAAALGG